MNNQIINVENLGKMYRIGGESGHPRQFRELIVGMLSAPLRRLRRLSEHGGDQREFWALRNVSFKVNQGEVVGVVGSNGAGKSTLLKLLSRITMPTEGEITYRGRVASLLEVGTGFHPELTGRENIFLNGSILGMRRAEIKDRFDEIVSFSGVEQFLDTPVKRYSSGMYVRLAFSVAAHLEPEILLIDEVLAVGDIAFQQRCLKKMNQVSTEDGRTVFFVSHNLAAVKQLCSRAILLEGGKVTMDGSTQDVLKKYLTSLAEGSNSAFTDNPNRSGAGDIRLVGGRLLNSDGESKSQFLGGDKLTIECDFQNDNLHGDMHVSMEISDQTGGVITEVSTVYTGTPLINLSKSGSFRCIIAKLPLVPGQYRVAINVWGNQRCQDLVPNAFLFDVIGSHFYSSSRSPDAGVCMVDHEWIASK
ncbi:MAG: ABC transporter ATP-binding protein [Phycisphaerales bacterium]|nr:ABC transporter ATP-binding protein [Phycisphaerales bacterium]